MLFGNYNLYIICKNMKIHEINKIAKIWQDKQKPC